MFSRIYRNRLADFFGAGCVAVLVLAGVNFGQWEISLTWGLGVLIAIYVAGGISGAHLNPAGAFCAAALVYFLYSNLFTQWELTHHVTRGTIESLGTAGIFSTYPHALLSNFQALVVELIITAVLMMSILALTDDQNGGPKGFAAALLIGILIAVIGAAMYVKLLAPCLPANRVLKAQENTSKIKATAEL